MSPPPIRQLPRVMPLARAATEVLGIDPHEACRLAREGQIPGAFKVGKLWFVSLLRMIREMQDEEPPEPDPLDFV